jgi:hypothetical protein
MADPQKPGQGIIVRADFGGGIDQSADAWRVPPSQLSSLTNGRLDRAGSIRKRTGYQAVAAPPASSPNTGNPIGAMASKSKTFVIDRARDNASLDASPIGSAQYLLGNESGYVARSYTPSATNDWTTPGAVSDVIGDVITWDGGAGEYDEAFDVGTDGTFVFVVKITRARKTWSTAALGGTTVQLTVTQYDGTTRAIVSTKTQTLSGYVYPKLLVYPTWGTLVITAAVPVSRAAINTTTTAARVELYTMTYTASGLGSFVTQTPTARSVDCDWSDLAAFYATSGERYRPVVPYDVGKHGNDAFFLVVYSSRTSQVRFDRFDVTAGTLNLVNSADIAKPGALPVVALALAIDDATSSIGLGATLMSLNMAAATPWQSANGVVYVAELTTALVLSYAANTAITRIAGVASHLAPGGGTIALTTATNTQRTWTYFAEVQDFDDVSPYPVYGHYVQRVGMRTNPAAIVDDQVLSVAVSSARAFTLPYFAKVTSTSRLQVRVPLVLGASQQNWVGQGPAPGYDNTTTFAANYTSNIGTAVLVGPIQRIPTCANSPAQTVAPRLMPTSGPRPFTLANVLHVPHRVALDGAGAFAFSTIALAARASGDVNPSTYGDVCHAVGGIVQTLDGSATTEAAIIDRPHISGIVRSNGGFAIDFANGDYLVQACFAYRDAAGNMHRSAPSDPYRITVLGAQDTWTIYYSRASYLDRTDAVIEFYVTEPNGTILRRWFAQSASTIDPSATVAGTTSINILDRGVAATNWAIGLPGTDAPLLYTSTGNLPHVPIASARFATLFKNRLIVGGADDPKSIYYSNPPVPFEGVSFAAGNAIRLEHESGCTAAGNVNDKLILLSSTGVYAVFGQFRDATGAGDALSEVESIHDYIGCTQPQSVISIPPGLIFFGSDSRFYLIDERLQLVPIGLKVQDLTASTTTGVRLDQVRAVVHIEAQREVRFYMADTWSLGPGGCLVYNYQVDQWSRDFSLSGTFQTALGACWSSNLSCFIVSTLAWAKDDGSTYLDGSDWISLNAQTAWIQPGGTQDYARFRYCQILGRSAADHNLTVKVYTDFDPSTVRSTATWTAAQLAPIPDTVWPEQVKLQIGNQKTQSVKIEIYDAAPSGATSGQGPQLVGLALELLPLGGVKRLPVTRKA